MAIYRGVAFVITKGQSVGSFPEAFRSIIRYESSGGLSIVPMGVMLLVAGLGWMFLSKMAVGRRGYAVGGNELASRYSGIRVERVRLHVFVIARISVGIAALLSIG
jgi:ribose/xylose/arabinose/galactoside ABC-type transport system permease subunit